MNKLYASGVLHRKDTSHTSSDSLTSSGGRVASGHLPTPVEDTSSVVKDLVKDSVKDCIAVGGSADKGVVKKSCSAADDVAGLSRFVSSRFL